MFDAYEWIRQEANLRRFEREAFPLYLRACAIDDDALAEQARLAWDARVRDGNLSHDLHLGQLFLAIACTDEYYGYHGTYDFRTVYTDAHPDIGQDEYERLFMESESRRTYKAWMKALMR